MVSLVLLPLLIILLIRYRFFRKATLIAGFVLFLGLIGGALLNSTFYTEYIDPLSGSAEAVEPLDYVASRQVQRPDNRFLLVNIGNVNRGGIADMINMISVFRPKVIGISAFFSCPPGLRDSLTCPVGMDTVANRKLAEAIQLAGNVVLPIRIIQRKETEARRGELLDSVEISDEQFQRYAFAGFANLPTTAKHQFDVKAVRSFLPTLKVLDSTMLAWPVVVAGLYDSLPTINLLKRRKEEELINFRGNIDVRRLTLARGRELDTTGFGGRYLAVEASDIIAGRVNPEEIRDRIVLMGYLGEYLGDPSADEKFFTPLNTQMSGRSNPDSFGLVVNANIISQILDQDYIVEQAVWDAWVVNFVFILFHVSVLLWLRNRWPKMFDLNATILIVIQITLFSYLRIWAFQTFSYRLFFDVSIFTLAIAGLGINIFLEIFPILGQRLRRRVEPGKEEVSHKER